MRWGAGGTPWLKECQTRLQTANTHVATQSVVHTADREFCRVIVRLSLQAKLLCGRAGLVEFGLTSHLVTGSYEHAVSGSGILNTVTCLD